jgi:hypothetical protein
MLNRFINIFIERARNISPPPKSIEYVHTPIVESSFVSMMGRGKKNEMKNRIHPKIRSMVLTGRGE